MWQLGTERICWQWNILEIMRTFDIQPTGSLCFGDTEDLDKVTGELSQVAV